MQHGSVPTIANIAPHSASASLLWYSFRYYLARLIFGRLTSEVAPGADVSDDALAEKCLFGLQDVILIRRQACLAKIAVEAPGPAVPSDEDFVPWQIDSLVAASKHVSFFAGLHTKRKK